MEIQEKSGENLGKQLEFSTLFSQKPNKLVFRRLISVV
jgi:hypothetical protein